MSQQAMALLEQIRALEPEDREWLNMRLLDDEECEAYDLTEDPEFHAELVRRLNDSTPTLSREEAESRMNEKMEAWSRERAQG